jgi:gluconolactonase
MNNNRTMLAVVAALCGTGWASISMAAEEKWPTQGPGVQARQDSREAAVLAKCKNPPPPLTAPANVAPADTAPLPYEVTAIPGVINAGEKWQVLWSTPGNNADGIIGLDDGSVLLAQNDNSKILRIDRDGKATVAYDHTNTSGALSINKQGELYVNERMLNPSIWQLAPDKRLFANRLDGEPLDCIGTVLNDLVAAESGNVYFTMGGLYRADPKGVVTLVTKDLRTNGITLSPDEKVLYVTNAGSLVAFDVQADGSLANQRTHATLPGGGGDGSVVDSAGRIYVTAAKGVVVLSPTGEVLGSIPVPYNVITVAFGGVDKKTLYAVAVHRSGKPFPRQSGSVDLMAIRMVSQGYLGRLK